AASKIKCTPKSKKKAPWQNVIISLQKRKNNRNTMGRNKLIIEKACKNTHFTWYERLRLQYYHNGTNGYPKTTSPLLLGKLFNKHEQTICRELKRGMVEHVDTNLRSTMCYNAEYAQNDANSKHSAKGPDLKLGTDWALANACSTLIKKQNYSPYAVLEHFKKYGWPSATRICEKTLYNYIESGYIPDITENDLLYAGNRKKLKSEPQKHSRKLNAQKSIDNRPKEANERSEPGHWEMDTVYGAKNTSPNCLLTLTERQNRTEIILGLPDRTAKSVLEALDSLEKSMGTADFKRLFLTITPDNGSEFADATGLETSINNHLKRTTVYYAHPYCSSERGTNENHNGMIRRFIPKGTDLGKVNHSEIRRIQNWMNNYPRKILGGNTPLESLKKQMGAGFKIPSFLDVAA
ncbi:MAG: IS30 family transposase, partial [Spirochaetales bacterium]|nr:IS30 family transposase [Spirochaetales bacterium]